MSLRVALYIRVSTIEQANEGLSLDTQLARCIDYARFKGWDGPFCLYMDAGASGASLTRRPAMTQLLEDVEAGRIGAVVVTKLDRAFRSVRDAADSLARLRKAGAVLAILDVQVDTSTAAGELVFNLMGTVAQFESKRIGERTHEVNRRLASTGRHLSSKPPFGYHRDPGTQQLVVHELEAAVVRRIFAEFTRDESSGIQSIANRLNAEGVPSPAGALWYRITIARVLRNAVYVGEVRYGANGPRSRQWLDDAGRVVAQGTQVPLIDRATWERARQKMLRRQTPGRDTSPARLYGGLVWCGHCGSRLYSASGSAHGESLYTCALVHKGRRADCPGSRRILNRTLDTLVTPALVANLARARAANWAPRAGPPRARTIPRDRAHVEERLRRLNRLYAEMEVDEAYYERQRAELRAELEAVDRPAEALPLPPAPLIEDPGAWLADVEVPLPHKRAFVERWIARIFVLAQEVRIEYRDPHLRGWRTEETLRRPRSGKRGKERAG